jgi:hypothetical protein
MTIRAVVLAAAAALLAGCPAYFVSEYDATTDRGVTALQGSIERHLGQLETLAREPPGLESLVEACKPDRFDDAYREMLSDLRSLIVRNEAREKNDLTVQQLKGLQESLATLQQLQRERYEPTDPERVITKPGDRCMGSGQIEATRQILEQHFRAILKLELAKRDFRKEE